MSRSVLVVEHAGPLVTIQDAGRPAVMRLGVPRSGPMDDVAHAVANVVLGRPPTSTAIEVSVGGLVVRCHDAPVTVAVCGGSFSVEHGGRRHDPWSVVTLRPGDRLALGAGAWGSWCTLAVAGVLAATRWMGSTSTHVRSGIGGGVVRPGDELVVEEPVADHLRDGPVDIPAIARPTKELRVVLGPQHESFPVGSVEAFLGGRFVLSSAYDRMGVRLDGPRLSIGESLGIASTPIVRGSVQVDGAGTATLLFADHQTVGGYPKIATVIGPDARRAAQLRAGDAVRFRSIDPAEAIRIARRDSASIERSLVELAGRPGPRSRDLLTANLVDGIVDMTDQV